MWLCFDMGRNLKGGIKCNIQGIYVVIYYRNTVDSYLRTLLNHR